MDEIQRKSIASAGGRARAAHLTPERRREIARSAVLARWRGTRSDAKARKCLDYLVGYAEDIGDRFYAEMLRQFREKIG